MLLAIGFMYVCALLLVPILGFAVWLLVDGDRMRAEQEAKEATGVVISLPAADTPQQTAATPPAQRHHASGSYAY